MVAQGSGFGLGDVLVCIIAFAALSPRRAWTAGLSRLSTWPSWGRYVVVAASTASWAYAAVLAITPPNTDAEKALAIQRVELGFVAFVVALGFAAFCEVRRERARNREDTEWHQRLHAGTRQEIAAEVRSTLLESDGARQRAAFGALHTRPTGAFNEHSPTHVKVESYMLARRIDQFLDAEDVSKYTDRERVDEYRDLFYETVQRRRGELARLGLSDGQLDLFSYRQEGAESIRLTARTLERLAEQLPEDEEYLKGEGGIYASALERYESWVGKSMEILRTGAKQFLEAPARKKPPVGLTKRAQHILDEAEGFVKSRGKSDANPRRLKDVLEKTSPRFLDAAQLQRLEAVRAATAAYDSETLAMYVSRYGERVTGLTSEAATYVRPEDDRAYLNRITKTPERLDDVMTAIWLLRVRLNTRGYPDDD